jgi:shikimate dehydrogenase
MISQSMISGKTRLLGIVGDPIAQVRSPQIYNPRLAEAGHDAVLLPVNLPETYFETGMRGLMSVANLSGLILTVPFKKRALQLVDRIERIGSQVGAINAMRRQADGRWMGDMFDGAGLLAALRSLGQDAAGRKVTLVGAGGAGSAIAIAVAAAGAASLHISDRHADRALELGRRVTDFYSGCRVTAGAPLVDGQNLLINATPAGMAPEFALAPFVGDLHPGLTVIDIVPSPKRARLLELAQQAGCPTANGQAMIAGQADAVLAFFGYPRG